MLSFLLQICLIRTMADLLIQKKRQWALHVYSIANFVTESFKCLQWLQMTSVHLLDISVLEFWKIKLENLSSMNWIFSLQKSISKNIGSKNSVRNRLKIHFVEMDFSKMIFQKSSTDQQEDRDSFGVISNHLESFKSCT